MTTKIGNRVSETSATTGTGTYTLLGQKANFQAFLHDPNISSGDSVLYAAIGAGSDGWEIGVGTITSGANDTLSRDTIIANDLATTAAKDWGAGTRTIICGIPADFFLTLIDRSVSAGFPALTGVWAFAYRTFAVTNGLTIANADGALGNPSIGHDNSAGNGFTEQTAVAKGDVLSGDGVDSWGRTTVGADGKFLKADSAQATGLSWDDAGDSFARQVGLGRISLGEQ